MLSSLVLVTDPDSGLLQKEFYTYWKVDVCRVGLATINTLGKPLTEAPPRRISKQIINMNHMWGALDSLTTT